MAGKAKSEKKSSSEPEKTAEEKPKSSSISAASSKFRWYVRQLCLIGTCMAAVLIVYSQYSENPGVSDENADSNNIADSSSPQVYQVGKPKMDDKNSNENPFRMVSDGSETISSSENSTTDGESAAMNEGSDAAVTSDAGAVADAAVTSDPGAASEPGVTSDSGAEMRASDASGSGTDPASASETSNDSGSADSFGSSASSDAGSSSSDDSETVPPVAAPSETADASSSSTPSSSFSSSPSSTPNPISTSESEEKTVQNPYANPPATTPLKDFPKTDTSSAAKPVYNSNTTVTGPDGRPRHGEVLVQEVGMTPKLKSPAGPPVDNFLEIFNFDATPDWIEERWSSISIVGPLHTRGYRVPLSTGPMESDLVGSLTYYFNNRLEVEKITFEGYTGSLDRLAMTLRYFNMSKRITSDPNAEMYASETLADNRQSYMKTYYRIMPIDEEHPNRKYWITMELYPPEH